MDSKTKIVLCISTEFIQSASPGRILLLSHIKKVIVKETVQVTRHQKCHDARNALSFSVTCCLILKRAVSVQVTVYFPLPNYSLKT